MNKFLVIVFFLSFTLAINGQTNLASDNDFDFLKENNKEVEFICSDTVAWPTSEQVIHTNVLLKPLNSNKIQIIEESQPKRLQDIINIHVAYILSGMKIESPEWSQVSVFVMNNAVKNAEKNYPDLVRDYLVSEYNIADNGFILSICISLLLLGVSFGVYNNFKSICLKGDANYQVSLFFTFLFSLITLILAILSLYFGCKTEMNNKFKIKNTPRIYIVENIYEIIKK